MNQRLVATEELIVAIVILQVAGSRLAICFHGMKTLVIVTVADIQAIRYQPYNVRLASEMKLTMGRFNMSPVARCIVITLNAKTDSVVREDIIFI